MKGNLMKVLYSAIVFWLLFLRDYDDSIPPIYRLFIFGFVIWLFFFRKKEEDINTEHNDEIKKPISKAHQGSAIKTISDPPPPYVKSPPPIQSPPTLPIHSPPKKKPITDKQKLLAERDGKILARPPYIV